MTLWPELSPENFRLAQPLFAATHYGVLAAGTLEGGHPGRVFINDISQPRLGLVCTRVGYYFLAGQAGLAEPITAADLDWLYTIFTGELIPRQKAESDNPEALLFFDPPILGDALLARFAAVRPVRITKKRHIFPAGNALKLRGWRDRLPDGLRAVPYSAELLAAQPALAEEAALFYGSCEAFLQKSLGVCILDGDVAAASNGGNDSARGIAACACCGVFTGNGEIEISIHTAEGYRRRGLATLAAAAFIEASLERGLRPIWGCWPENVPSMLLARKLGFIEDCDQPLCLWVDSPEWDPGGD